MRCAPAANARSSHNTPHEIAGALGLAPPGNGESDDMCALREALVEKVDEIEKLKAQVRQLVLQQAQSPRAAKTIVVHCR